MNANELFEKIRVKQVIGTLDINVTDITTDSRTASEGVYSSHQKAIQLIAINFVKMLLIKVQKSLWLTINKTLTVT